jgi:hypothetical protein
MYGTFVCTGMSSVPYLSIHELVLNAIFGLAGAESDYENAPSGRQLELLTREVRLFIVILYVGRHGRYLVTSVGRPVSGFI